MFWNDPVLTIVVLLHEILEALQRPPAHRTGLGCGASLRSSTHGSRPWRSHSEASVSWASICKTEYFILCGWAEHDQRNQ